MGNYDLAQSRDGRTRRLSGQKLAMELSAVLCKKVLPWRGGPVSFTSPDLKRVVARLREVRALEALQPAFKKAEVEVDREHRQALLKRIEGPIEQLGAVIPEVEGALLCLLGANDHAWDRAHEIGADMVHLWCSRGTVAQATAALLVNAEYNGSGQRSREHKFQAYFPYVGPWRALRGYLAAAPEADYQAALQLVREQAWDQVTWLAAVAFGGERELVEQAIADVLGRPAGMRGIGLLSCAFTGEQFARLCEHLKDYLGREDFTNIKLGDYLPSSVARLGNDSFEGLRILAESAERLPSKRMLAELMVELDHPAVGPWLAARLKDKAFGPAHHAYAAKGAAPAAAPAVVGDEPDLLSNPPWNRRAARLKPSVQTVVLPALEERVHFAEGRHQFILENTVKRGADRSKAWRERFEQHSGGAFPEELCELDDAAWALRQWNECPAGRWNPYSLRSSYWITVPERMLAVFGAEAIPGILTTLSVAPDVNYAALGMVESVRLAPVWAEAWGTKKKFRKAASAWFLRFPRTASLGLLPAALGPAGKARAQAEAVLRWMASKGQSEKLRAAAAELEAGPGLEQILSYDPLQELPAKMPALPAWFRPDLVVAPRTCKGQPLSQSALSNLALMAAISTLETPYAGLAQSECEPSSLAAFAWSVYQQWLDAGGPAKEDWGFKILAYWGGDEAARRLAPDLRKWPAEGLSSRAGVGLDILRYLGSDVALTHLHGIALKVRFKALQDKARAHIQEIADERGLSVDELGDRLVPTLETESLSPYEVVFDELLRPRLKGLGELPKSAPPPLAEAWKALKKDAKTVAAVQLERLEQALTGQRRWTHGVFRSLLVEHPLMIHLVRRLVWGVYGPEGLQRTFRVAEDLSYADSRDEAVLVEGSIGLFHPLDDPECLSAWRGIFADYQILQPFEQLGRSVHRLPADFSGCQLDTYAGLQLAGGHLFSLEGRGWQRGTIESGCLLDLLRGPLRLELDEGLAVEMVSGSTVVLGKLVGTSPLQELSPIVVSEALRDLESLRAKA